MPGPLLVVTGPPGAGKSTVAKAVAERQERSVLVEGDAFFAFLCRGAVAPWRRDAQEQNAIVTEAAAAATGRYAKGGYYTVYDGVVGPWFLPTFMAGTGLDSLHYVILLPSVERCMSRVTTRTGHGFADPAATRQMHEGFARADLAPRHVLVDPPEAVDVVVDEILGAAARGQLAYPGPP